MVSPSTTLTRVAERNSSRSGLSREHAPVEATSPKAAPVRIASKRLLTRISSLGLATFPNHGHPDVLTELIQVLLPQRRVGDAHMTGSHVSKAKLPGRFCIGALDEETGEAFPFVVLPVIEQGQNPAARLPGEHHRRPGFQLPEYGEEVGHEVTAQILHVDRRMVPGGFAVVEMQAMAQANRFPVAVRTGSRSLRCAHDSLIVSPYAQALE